MVLQPLRDHVAEDILPSVTPDEDCLTMPLRNQDGDVAEIKSKKPIEVITDPNDPLVIQWMKDHGSDAPGYRFWGGRGRMTKRSDGASYEVFQGSWDIKMTHEQYLGLAEWMKDCRYFNCRSRCVFSKKNGEPYIGICMPNMPSIAWKILEYMTSSHDQRYRYLGKHLQEWYKNVSRIGNKLLRGHGWQQYGTL